MATLPMPQITSPHFKANPYPFYARLRAEAPVYHTALPSKQSAWLITRYSDVLAAIKDERLVKDRLNVTGGSQPARPPWVPGFLKPLARNMLDLDGADHSRLRALVHMAFTPRRIEQLRERIQALCDEMIGRALRHGSIELIHEYALPLPATIIAELLGVPVADRHAFQRWSQAMVSIVSAGDMLLALPQIWRFLRYLRTLCARRRADPRDDMITALLQAEQAGDSLSEDELLAMILLLLVAGHETTVNLIASGTLALLQHPDELARLRQDPSLITSAVEELLRFTSPVEIATERYAREDMNIAGVDIPAGGLVLAVLGSANRDEQQFEQPDRLDLTRAPNRHLAFSQGAHYCLGASLARMESQIAIQTLLRHSPNMRLRSSAEALAWKKGLFLRGLRQLPLALA